MGMLDEDTKLRMEKSLKNLRDEYHTLRTGRAAPTLLDKIVVDYYGTPTPLRQLANISVPEPCELLIQPFDRNLLKEIEKAIQSSDLGLAPNNDGKNIRLQIPLLTDERRKDLVKEAKGMAEKARVSVRNIRREMNEKIKRNKELSEDDQKHETQEIQKITDKVIGQIDSLLSDKEKEILEI